jgi:triacylglycerol lipase
MDTTKLGAALCSVALTVSCASGASGGHTPCEAAVAAIEACTGAPIAAPFTASCSATEDRTARALLDELDASGCGGRPGAKSDAAFCSSWDPLGLCDEPPPSLLPEPRGEPTRLPILLAHGFNTSTTNDWSFHDVDVALAADGHVVALGSVPPYDSPEARAEHLAEQVDELLARTGATHVNLVCFSQGGLDCRYLASENGLGYGDRVATITTIATPHRGTGIADAAAAVLPDPRSASSRLADALATAWGRRFSELASDSHFVAAMESMTTARMAEWNREVVDHPAVEYQSWAGFSYVAGLASPRDTRDALCRDDDGELQLFEHPGRRDIMDPLLVGASGFVAFGTELRPNDGITAIESARWGTFRGCVPADHLDLVGQIGDRGPDRRTGFDYLRLYRSIAFDLAARGH